MEGDNDWIDLGTKPGTSYIPSRYLRALVPLASQYGVHIQAGSLAISPNTPYILYPSSLYAHCVP